MRRKCRRVFWDALVSLGISWGIANYINPVDLEAKIYLALGLGILCLLIILPKALRSLPQNKPWRAAISLPLMLSPLIYLFSWPYLYYNPFSVPWHQQGELALPWALNGAFYSLIFFLAGYLIAKSTPDEKPITWSKSFFFTTTIILVYAGMIYLGSYLYFQA